MMMIGKTQDSEFRFNNELHLLLICLGGGLLAS